MSHREPERELLWRDSASQDRQRDSVAGILACRNDVRRRPGRRQPWRGRDIHAIEAQMCAQLASRDHASGLIAILLAISHLTQAARGGVRPRYVQLDAGTIILQPRIVPDTEAASPTGVAWGQPKIWSMISAPVAMTGRKFLAVDDLGCPRAEMACEPRDLLDRHTRP